ncbi:MAG: DUF3352 domain-containing protein [Actinomycetota bacterium]|nr:DUF3352 domain-containing protein [Actinomycetota bacterium]
MRKAIVVGILGLLAVGGIAYGAMSFWAGAVEDEAVDLVPGDAAVYANVFLNPSRNQKRAIRDLLAKFEEAPTPDEATDELAKLIDEGLEDVGLTFKEDIDPWLGRQVAFFASDFEAGSPTAAALIETEDEAATREVVDKLDDQGAVEPQDKSYEGVEYTFYAEDEQGNPFASGFVEDFWVVGSEDGFKAVVDASKGESLAENEQFVDTTGLLSDDYLALFYFDAERLVNEAVETGDVTEEDLRALEAFPGFTEQGPAAASLYVQDDGAVFELASSAPEDDSLLRAIDDSGLLNDLPRDSWFAFGVSGVGNLFSTMLESVAEGSAPEADLEFFEEQFASETGLDLRDDVLAWMEDAGVFVEGTTMFEIQGGVVIESGNPEKSSEATQVLGDYIAAQGAPVTPAEVEGVEGFSVQQEGMPQPVYVLGGDRVVIAYGRDATERAISGTETLEDSEAFQGAGDALGDDFTPSFFLDMGAVIELVEGLGASQDATYQQDVKPWVDPLSHVVYGTKLDGDIIVGKLVIGVE